MLMFHPVIRDLIRPAWCELLELLLKSGPLPVRGIAAKTGDSYMTIKSRCEELVKTGYLLRTRVPRPDLGRPEIHYSLAPAADALFPDHSDETIIALLDHARGMFGDHAPEKLLFRHFESIAAKQAPLLAAISDPFRKLETFCQLRKSAGHVCDLKLLAGGARLTEYHHPLQAVIQRYPRAIAMELRAIEETLNMRVIRNEQSAGRGRTPHTVFDFTFSGANFP